MQVQRERSLRASPAAPQPLIIMITLDSCTELFLRLDSHNTIFGCAKRTSLLACFLPKIKDSRVLTVIRARAVRRQLRERAAVPLQARGWVG